jgi:hypothetical protein
VKPLAILIVAVVLLAGTPALPLPGHAWWPTWPTVPSIVSPVATAAVYVYEKDDGPIPPGVLSGIDRLNRERNLVASLFEDDSTDGTGEVPEQYRPALAAAKAALIPALVVLSGTTAVKVVPKPLTEEQVMGAVR